MHSLLPDSIIVRQGDVAANVGPVWPEETSRISGATECRRAEFAAGRTLARQALAALGALPCAIPAGPDGAPQWPAGFVGSIAHSRRHAVAAVALQTDIAALGIDIEDGARFKPTMERMVLLPAEIAALPTDASRPLAATILFCAKEAFYKMQYPLSGLRLTFQDATVEITAPDRFCLSLQTSCSPIAGRRRFCGRYLVRDGIVRAAIFLSRAGAVLF